MEQRIQWDSDDNQKTLHIVNINQRSLSFLQNKWEYLPQSQDFSWKKDCFYFWSTEIFVLKDLLYGKDFHFQFLAQIIMGETTQNKIWIIWLRNHDVITSQLSGFLSFFCRSNQNGWTEYNIPLKKTYAI